MDTFRGRLYFKISYWDYLGNNSNLVLRKGLFFWTLKIHEHLIINSFFFKFIYEALLRPLRNRCNCDTVWEQIRENKSGSSEMYPFPVTERRALSLNIFKLPSLSSLFSSLDPQPLPPPLLPCPCVGLLLGGMGGKFNFDLVDSAVAVGKL